MVILPFFSRVRGLVLFAVGQQRRKIHSLAYSSFFLLPVGVIFESFSGLCKLALTLPPPFLPAGGVSSRGDGTP